MPSRIGILASAMAPPLDPLDGIWLDASAAQSATLTTVPSGNDTLVTQWSSRGVWPGTFRMNAGQAVYAPYLERTPAKPRDGVRCTGLQGVEWLSPANGCINLAGPLTVYAALTALASTDTSSMRIPLLRSIDDSSRSVSSIAVYLGQDWVNPSIQRTTVDPFVCMHSTPSYADWSAPTGALRIVAVSVPGIGQPGEAKWYLGDGTWVRQGQDDVAAGREASPHIHGFTIGYGNSYLPSSYSLHELHVVPRIHSDRTMAAVYADLWSRWSPVA